MTKCRKCGIKVDCVSPYEDWGSECTIFLCRSCGIKFRYSQLWPLWCTCICNHYWELMDKVVLEWIEGDDTRKV